MNYFFCSALVLYAIKKIKYIHESRTFQSELKELLINQIILYFSADMPGVKVLATYRGCFSMSLNETLKSVATEGHKLRMAHFHLCNYTLCNSATRNIMALASYFVWLITYFVISSII